MLVQIGAKGHSFSDPTALLSDCDRRVEMFLKVLETVAGCVDQPLAEETTRVLESALRHFAEAAPKHTADEEESLFPRLRQMDDPDLHSASARMNKLEDNHRRTAPLLSEVERMGKKYLSTGTLSDADVAIFRNAVASLATMYKEHITVEDELIFPLAARVLSQGETSAIASEMAGRSRVRIMTDMFSS